MEITYAGANSFVLKGERTVVINPSASTERADIPLYTRRQKSKKLLINGPGEYEIGGVLVTSVALGDDLVHAVEVDGINVLHLTGDARKLTDRDLSAIGKVDILLVEAAELKQAQNAVSDLTPRVVIPFGAHAAEVCATSGVKDAQPQARFTWNGVTAPARAMLLKEPAKKRSKERAA
jgi:hypothetical protein